MMSKTTFCTLFCCMMLCLHASGQTESRNISGVILDGNQLPVAGAIVVVKGTANGTTSDGDGTFRLTVPQTGTLVASYPGFTTIETPLSASIQYRIVLEENTQLIDELVVVGYGTMRKKDLTGSIIQIRPDNIAVENPNTIQDILRSTPGLQVGYDASAKGGGSLQIRGQHSVYTQENHNSPLLVLDGVIFFGELSEINPDDIGQIDILKDASAAAIYGAKSANGVIIITTKKGKKGKPVVNFTSNFGLSEQVSNRERFTPAGYLQHLSDWLAKNTYGVNPSTGEYEAYAQIGSTPIPVGYYTNPNQLPSGVSVDDWRGYTVNDTDESNMSIWARRVGLKGNALENFRNGESVDWEKKAFRIGFNQDYSASVSGAGEKANYYFSMGYLKNQGVRMNDDYTTVRANMKVDFDVNKWFSVGANVNFQDRSDGNKDMALGSILENSPYGDYADAYGNPVQYPLDGNYASRRGYNYDFNKNYEELERGYTTLNSVFNAKISLPFNITYTFNAAPRMQFYYDRQFLSSELPDSDETKRGANRESRKRFDWSLNNTINWDHTFCKHHVVLTLVQEAEERQYWRDRIESRMILPSDALGFHNTQNGTKEYSSFSTSDSHETADALLARVFYSYDDRYMITASIRRDGYCAFGTSNPYATFPSVAVAWTFTNEKFLDRIKNVMNYGKLRVSYGKNGNRSLENPYVALSNLSAGAGKMHGYIGTKNWEEDLYRYLMVDRMKNPNLQWEKTTSWNLGLDFGFLNNRLTGFVEYYRSQTRDMIMFQSLPEITGFSNITTNLGQVDNNGIEVSLQSLNIDRKKFTWTTSLGFAYNKNIIRHLYYDYVDGVEQDDITSGWFIGQPINTIWDYRVTGIWQKHEIEEAKRHGQLPGDPKVANLYTEDDRVNADGSVTPVYNDKDKEFLGQTDAPYRWSLRNEFTFWKSLTVSFNLYSYMGHKSLSGNYLNNDDSGGRLTNGIVNLPRKEYWTVDNPTNEYARIQAAGPTGAASPSKLYDRSFIRLENVSVAYILPQKWTTKVQIERVKVFGTVRNLTRWANEWEYGDPETGDWASRIYTMGINLTF